MSDRNVISEHALAKSLNLLETTDHNFKGGFIDAFDVFGNSTWLFIYQPWIRFIANSIPTPIARRASKPAAAILNLLGRAKDSSKAYKSLDGELDRPVVFDALGSLATEASVSEAINLLVAGSDTTGFTIAVGLYHICQNPKIKSRLSNKLITAIADPNQIPSLTTLENLRYLTACLKDSIRVARAVEGRLPRLVPSNLTSPLIVDGKVIPPGTVVGISAYTMHRSTELWGPDATIFNPDRWLDSDSKDQHMVSFSKEPRSCLAQNLANAEGILLLDFIVRKFEMEISPGSANPEDERDGMGDCGTQRGRIDAFNGFIREPGILHDMKGGEG